jgi:hypothetical protein
MTEQVQPLLTMLASMRKKLMEPPPAVIPSVLTATGVLAATEPNPSPLTLDTDSDADDNAITLLETPVQ